MKRRRKKEEKKKGELSLDINQYIKCCKVEGFLNLRGHSYQEGLRALIRKQIISQSILLNLFSRHLYHLN